MAVDELSLLHSLNFLIVEILLLLTAFYWRVSFIQIFSPKSLASVFREKLGCPLTHPMPALPWQAVLHLALSQSIKDRLMALQVAVLAAIIEEGNRPMKPRREWRMH